MVRAHMKQTPEEKKEAHKKKTPAKKKSETGQWPCKINGCNKVFAREADLKRHQRTTKLHSMPGFACPQCDATFTRTDALRRHQKSRHNGIIVAGDQDKPKADGSGEAGPSGSKSPSRSATPSRSQGDQGSTKGSPPTQPAAGGSSYYRAHTHTMSAYVPPRPPPGAAMEHHYPPSIGPPTSAARLHPSTPWVPHPAPVWGPDGHPMHPPPGAMYPPYPPPPAGYYPPYYRPPPGMPMPPHQYPVPPEYAQGHPPYPPPPNGAAPAPPAGDKSAEKTEERESDAEMEDGSSQADEPVIDPSLQERAEPEDKKTGEKAQDKGKEEEGVGIEKKIPADGEDSDRKAAEAVKAVIEANQSGPVPAAPAPLAEFKEKAQEQAPTSAPQTALTSSEEGARHEGEDKPAVPPVEQPPAPAPTAGAPDADMDVDADADGEAEPESETPKDDAKEQKPPAGGERSDILMEDGVTMLNPAELLTQESLASPPP